MLPTVEQATPHYHICWSTKGLDYESFATREAAEASAKWLKRPNEDYTVEEFHDGCKQCQARISPAVPIYAIKRNDGRFLSQADGWSDLRNARFFSPMAALAALDVLDQVQPGCIPLRVTLSRSTNTD